MLSKIDKENKDYEPITFLVKDEPTSVIFFYVGSGEPKAVGGVMPVKTETDLKTKIETFSKIAGIEEEKPEAVKEEKPGNWGGEPETVTV